MTLEELIELTEYCKLHPTFFETFVGDRLTTVVFQRCSSLDELKEKDRKLGGDRDKEFTDEDFRVIRRVAGCRFILYVNRELVCKKIVVGTTKVQKSIYTRVDIPNEFVEIEQVEWECPESGVSLLGE